jgi:hypothetical protein
MRVVVIGGTGHIGTYLVPGLVRAGHDVVVISRGSRRPYRDDPLWGEVERVTCDRVAAESDGSFGSLVAGLRPDAVVDLTCFTPAQAEQLVLALDGQHLVHTGSVWSYGPSAVVPTTEDAVKKPYGEYGIGKLAIERYLMGQERVRATVVHPGTSAARAGYRSGRPATWTRPSSTPCAPMARACCRTAAARPSITCMPTTSRPCTRPASSNPTRRSARASTACAPRH